MAVKTTQTPLPSFPARTPSEAVRAPQKSVKFFGWWWSEEELVRAGLDETKATKNTYLELNEWVSGVSGEGPEPDYVDVVYCLKNQSGHPQDFIVTASAYFKWAPPDLSLNADEDEDVDKLLAAIPWSSARKIGLLVVRNVAPGESREVKFTDFNLRSIAGKYLSEDGTRLPVWPWKFKAGITVKGADGKLVQTEEGILDVILDD